MIADALEFPVLAVQVKALLRNELDRTDAETITSYSTFNTSLLSFTKMWYSPQSRKRSPLLSTKDKDDTLGMERKLLIASYLT